MEKEFVPCVESMTLRELGFDEPCLGFYDGKGNTTLYFNNLRDASGDFKPFIQSERLTWFGAPTFQQAFRFFREKYGLFIRPDFDTDYIDELDEFQTTYFFSILKIEESLIGFKSLGRLNNKKTYEEAELECLNKLIEIVKNEI